ncbi:MAG: hypothetical protein Q4G50_02925 [Corynebacterium sp.]|uniref:hypothetical protein n=1 Tax=Corynebacterium sp. TaxID=1720 RepID=UPI0026DF3088|nr:hypothetical protein [Corynebacterium sp.]MDO5668937.1 hypothetical protein [Corynebacterium sp.]
MNPQDPETSSFPAQYPPPQQIPPQAPPRRDRSGLAVVLLALLFLGAVALGVWMYNAFLRSDQEPAPTAAPTPTTVVTVTPTTTSDRPTTTVTSTSEPEPEPEPTTEETTTEEPTTPPPPAYRAPDDAVQCAANVNWRIFRANDQTSCAFAENVAIGMAGHAGDDTAHEIRVNSPVTGQNYLMSCYPQGDNTFICEGGDQAVVILEDRAVRD